MLDVSYQKEKIMSTELKLLISKLARDTQIPYKSLSLAVKKAILSGRITQQDLIHVLRKVAD
jgi:hypothetical protein